jgi:hypothetical protein
MLIMDNVSDDENLPEAAQAEVLLRGPNGVLHVPGKRHSRRWLRSDLRLLDRTGNPTFVCTLGLHRTTDVSLTLVARSGYRTVLVFCD